MGAWGPRAFENDDACDWKVQLEAKQDLTLIEITLANFLASGGSDSWIAAEAIAACDVLARLSGCHRYHDVYTESIDRWVTKFGQPAQRRLVETALTSLDLARSDESALKQEWAENDGPGDWELDVIVLQRCLSAQLHRA